VNSPERGPRALHVIARTVEFLNAHAAKEMRFWIEKVARLSC
jgi:hypothetical protein